MAEQYNLITYSNGSYQYKKIEYTPLTKMVEQRKSEEQDENERKNYLEFLNQYLSDFFTNNHIINENNCSYLTNRGISLKIQQQYVVYGQIIKCNFHNNKISQQLLEIHTALNRIENNINQVAYKVNIINKVYQADMNIIQKQFEEFLKQFKKKEYLVDTHGKYVKVKP